MAQKEELTEKKTKIYTKSEVREMGDAELDKLCDENGAVLWWASGVKVLFKTVKVEIN
jgi:hypothetical protein